MFYFEDYRGRKILKSDLINEITAYFTTRGDVEFPTSERLIHPTQTHSTNIELVDKRSDYPNTDSLILQNKNDTIYLKFADCTPIILYDSIQHTGAIAHAGWRGTVGKIGVKTVHKMLTLGCKLENIKAVIGPAISICCYEVSEDVKENLLSTVKNSSNLSTSKKVDLKRINARQLEEIGIKQIDICPYCTSCNNDLFYSYRKENGTQKRHFAVLNLQGN